MSHEPERIPPLLLIGLGALVATSVVGVAAARIADIGVQSAPAVRVVESITVLFKDEADGAVGVYSAENGERIHRFAPETGGFVRTAMRAVAHKRKVAGAAGAETPFVLARTQEGRLLLTDIATGETVSLEAFGDSNERDFAQLLPSNKKDDDA